MDGLVEICFIGFHVIIFGSTESWKVTWNPEINSRTAKDTECGIEGCGNSVECRLARVSR